MPERNTDKLPCMYSRLHKVICAFTSIRWLGKLLWDYLTVSNGAVPTGNQPASTDLVVSHPVHTARIDGHSCKYTTKPGEARMGRVTRQAWAIAQQRAMKVEQYLQNDAECARSGCPHSRPQCILFVLKLALGGPKDYPWHFCGPQA